MAGRMDLINCRQSHALIQWDAAREAIASSEALFRGCERDRGRPTRWIKAAMSCQKAVYEGHWQAETYAGVVFERNRWLKEWTSQSPRQKLLRC